jgi:hypothetical protein
MASRSSEPCGRIILGLRAVDVPAAKIHLRPYAGVLFSQTHPSVDRDNELE